MNVYKLIQDDGKILWIPTRKIDFFEELDNGRIIVHYNKNWSADLIHTIDEIDELIYEDDYLIEAEHDEDEILNEYDKDIKKEKFVPKKFRDDKPNRFTHSEVKH